MIALEVWEECRGLLQGTILAFPLREIEKEKETTKIPRSEVQ
jgi:hypothetical protein